VDRHSGLGASVADLIGSKIVTSRPLRGGDVAASYRVELADGRTVFAKTHASPPANFFDTEARGLSWLRAAQALPVPQVLGVSDEPPLLVLEWIDEAGGLAADEGSFGYDLAKLHRTGAPCFGRDDRRTTGSRGLPNEPCETWVDFYATQRLLPLAQLAADTGTYDADEQAVIETLAGRLDIVGGPAEPPARLHGDLWAGNRIVDSDGASWLIDPACHGGHREFDLAMMRLFGGFGSDAFAGYEQATPLADGWQDRIGLHQLAPLLVHAIKFGGRYIGSALATARNYL
jgi:fructosamine-3-kinase